MPWALVTEFYAGVGYVEMRKKGLPSLLISLLADHLSTRVTLGRNATILPVIKLSNQPQCADFHLIPKACRALHYSMMLLHHH